MAFLAFFSVAVGGGLELSSDLIGNCAEEAATSGNGIHGGCPKRSSDTIPIRTSNTSIPRAMESQEMPVRFCN